jgi:Kef-type K+ transport system membrane component KefB/K+/H+ antiporter YhaU regulatory subunit KhtT
VVHLPGLISDLALILVTAGVVALIFRRLKQPVVLGYLLAGVLVGPHISLLPTVQDTSNIKIWAELGIIFLLFVLGLEFSFRKLFRVGRPALIAASVEVFLMTGLGFLVGSLLGWTAMDSLFLGGILAISSTTIIIKAFQELGVKTQAFASLVFGILIIEDLYAVILLAILSTVGATRNLEGIALLRQLGELSLFLLIAIPTGVWVIPRLLKWVRSQFDDEIRVILSLGLCLGMVVVATAAGFSAALGAFLMGAFLSESVEGERAERLLKPIRDFFGAIFFTSVGMLVDLRSIYEHFDLVILLSLVTIVGKVMLTALGSLVGGEDKRTALQAGLSLGQIGEFSFIIATLGLSLGVVRPELYHLSVSVALITTFTTPYFIRLAQRLPVKGLRTRRRRGGQEPRLWGGHLVELEIHPHFKHAGKSLSDLELRERFSVSVVSILRGEHSHIAPTRDTQLLPYDRLVVLGEDSALAKLEKFLVTERYRTDPTEEAIFGLQRLLVTSGCGFVGLNLRESRIRERVHGIVLGIERARERILNPDSKLVIQEGDILWLYGNLEEIKTLENFGKRGFEPPTPSSQN